MIKNLQKWLVIVPLLFVLAGSVQAFDLMSWAVSTGLDLIAKPDMLFVDMQNDVDSATPGMFSERQFDIYTNPGLDLLTVANLGFRARLLKDDVDRPSLYLGCSYWNFVGLSLLDKYASIKASAQGFTPVLTASKQVEEDLALYAGFKYPVGFVNVDLSKLDLASSLGSGLGSFSSLLKNIKSTYQDPTIFVGISFLHESGTEATASVGYMMLRSKVYARVQLSGKVMAAGISFYPESILLLHPYFDIHVRF